MADYYGVNTTLLYTGGVQKITAGGQKDGRVKVYFDTYVIGGSAETSGKTLLFAGYGAVAGKFGQLPAGATILKIGIGFSTTQSSLTLAVGNLYSASAFCATIGTFVAGISQFVIGAGVKVGTNTGDDCVLFTTGGATMTLGTMYVSIFYTTD